MIGGHGSVAPLWIRLCIWHLKAVAELSVHLQRFANCIFMARGIGGNINAVFETFNANKLCSRGLSKERQFYSLKQ